MTAVLRLVIAEILRAASRAQTRRVLVGGGLALVLFSVVEHRASGPGAAAGIADALGGLQTAAPLVALVLAILYTGKWWTNGTAALVMTWTPRRWQLTAAETVATTAVVATVCASLWWWALLVLSPDALLDPHTALAAPIAVAVPLAAVLGASIATLCRSSTGGIVVIVGAYVFGEPLLHAGVEPLVGPTIAWFLPVTSLLEVAGAVPSGPAADAPPAWVVAAAWCLAAVVATQIMVHRRDLA